jgi:hypothetical protein
VVACPPLHPRVGAAIACATEHVCADNAHGYFLAACFERNVFIMMARMDSHSSVTTRSQHAHTQHAHLDTQPSAARVRQDRGPPGRLHLVQQGRRQLLHDLAQPAHPPCVPASHLALFCVHLATSTLCRPFLLIRIFPNVPSKRPPPSPITLHSLPLLHA